MIQSRYITVNEAINHAKKSNKIAYALAYHKELSKNGSLYVVKHNDIETLRSTSIEAAVNEYNLID